jgi:hypothetical protein
MVGSQFTYSNDASRIQDAITVQGYIYYFTIFLELEEESNKNH